MDSCLDNWLQEVCDLRGVELRNPTCRLHVYEGYETTWWSWLYEILKMFKEANEDVADKKIKTSTLLTDGLRDLNLTCLVHNQWDFAS